MLPELTHSCLLYHFCRSLTSGLTPAFEVRGNSWTITPTILQQSNPTTTFTKHFSISQLRPAIIVVSSNTTCRFESNNIVHLGALEPRTPRIICICTTGGLPKPAPIDLHRYLDSQISKRNKYTLNSLFEPDSLPIIARLPAGLATPLPLCLHYLGDISWSSFRPRKPFSPYATIPIDTFQQIPG